MKRMLGITLSALVLVLVAAVAFAQDSTATAPPSGGTTSEAPAKAAPKHRPAKGAAKHAMVDINSASKEDLAKLPGLSDEIADKIIAARPFKSRMELVAKKIVTRAQFRKIRTMVTAKPS